MKKNAILFSNVDREDYWVSGGICFKVENTGTYVDAFNEIKHKLETPEMIQYIIDDYSLLSDLFEGDETYKLVTTVWKDFSLVFVFENSEGDTKEHKKSANFIYLSE